MSNISSSLVTGMGSPGTPTNIRHKQITLTYNYYFKQWIILFVQFVVMAKIIMVSENNTKFLNLKNYVLQKLWAKCVINYNRH